MQLIKLSLQKFSPRQRVMLAFVLLMCALLIGLGLRALFIKGDIILPNAGKGFLKNALSASPISVEACPPIGQPGSEECTGNASVISNPIIENVNNQMADAADACISEYLKNLNTNNKNGVIPADIPEEGTKNFSATPFTGTSCSISVSRNGILPEFDSLNVIKPLAAKIKITQSLVSPDPVNLSYSSLSIKSDVVETTPITGSVTIDADTYLLYNKDAKTGERFWTRGLKPFATAQEDLYSLSNSTGNFNGSYLIDINARNDLFAKKREGHELKDFLKANGLTGSSISFENEVSGVNDAALDTGPTGGYGDGDSNREHKTFWYESTVGKIDGKVGFTWKPDASGNSVATFTALSFCPNGCTLTHVEERNIIARKTAVTAPTPANYPEDYFQTSCLGASGNGCSYLRIRSSQKRTEVYSGKGAVDLASATVRWDNSLQQTITDESEDRHGLQAKVQNSVLGAAAAASGVAPLMEKVRTFDPGIGTDYEYTYTTAELADLVQDDYQYLTSNKIETVVLPFQNNKTTQTITNSAKLDHTIINQRTALKWNKINSSNIKYTRSGAGANPLNNASITLASTTYSDTLNNYSKELIIPNQLLKKWKGHFTNNNLSVPVIDEYKEGSVVKAKIAVPTAFDSPHTIFMNEAGVANWLTPIHFGYLNSFRDKNGNLVSDMGSGFNSTGIIQSNILQIDSNNDGLGDCKADTYLEPSIVSNFVYGSDGKIKLCDGTKVLQERNFFLLNNSGQTTVLSTIPVTVLPNSITVTRGWDTTDAALNTIYTAYSKAMNTTLSELKFLNPKSSVNDVSTNTAIGLNSILSAQRNQWFGVIAPSFDEGWKIGKVTDQNSAMLFGIASSMTNARNSRWMSVSEQNCSSGSDAPLREVFLAKAGLVKDSLGSNAFTAFDSALSAYRNSLSAKSSVSCPARGDLLFFNHSNINQEEEMEPSYIALSADGNSIIHFSRAEGAFFSLPVNLDDDQLPSDLGTKIGTPVNMAEGSTVFDVKYSPDRTKAYLLGDNPDGIRTIILFEFSSQRSVILPSSLYDVAWRSNTQAVAISYEDNGDKLVSINPDGTGRKDLTGLTGVYEQISFSGDKIALMSQKNEITMTIDFKSITGSVTGSAEIPCTESAFVIPSPKDGNFVVGVYQADYSIVYWLLKGNGEKQLLELPVTDENINWTSDGSSLVFIHQDSIEAPFQFIKYTLSSGNSVQIKNYVINPRCSQAYDLTVFGQSVYFNCSTNIVGFKNIL